MKAIPLTQGRVALVDDKDFAKVGQFKWHTVKIANKRYAARKVRRNGKKGTVYMHRAIRS